MKTIILITSALLMTCMTLNAQVHKDSTHKAHTMNKDQVLSVGIPASLKSEHEELHEKLKKYTKLPGKTGAAAKEVARLLHPHFIKEEKYALPPLGLLADLAKDEATIDMADRKEAIAMSEKLQEDFTEMLAEHEQIVKALEQLDRAAKTENHPEVIRFTEALKLHAKTEEEVLYPAAILVGLYLKLRS